MKRSDNIFSILMFKTLLENYKRNIKILEICRRRKNVLMKVLHSRELSCILFSIQLREVLVLRRKERPFRAMERRLSCVKH